MTDCARNCTVFRKHRAPCPVSDGSDGMWVAWDPPGDWVERFAELNVVEFDMDPGFFTGEPRGRVRARKRDTWELWHTCKGCLPREARHGTLCESCHVRLEGWLHGQQVAGRWQPDTGSIAWAYDWLDEDRIPTQMMGAYDKISSGKKAPPAALNLMIHDLREEMAQALAQWLGMVCQQFGLYGPEWWHRRVEEAKRREQDRSRDAYAPMAEADWRAWLPQTSAEVIDAQRYLHNWLDRIESVPDVAVSIYDTASELVKKVAGVAPWEPKPRRLGREVVCPECERPALVIMEGQTSVTCMRCSAVFGREKYDLWAEVIRSERVAV